MNRLFVRSGVTLTATGLLVLAGAGIASAHVTAHSPDQLTQGGDAEIVFRSPNESQNQSPMTKLTVNFPLGTPLSNADVEPVPGWTAQVTMTHLATPVKMTDLTVTDAVGSITWTTTGAGLADGQFQEFPISTEGLPTNTSELVFTAVQTYADGEVVNWNQPTPPNGPEPDNPAPHLALAAAGSDGDTGGVTAAATPAAAQAGTSDDTARWLGGIGVVLAAAALGFGLGAWLRGRRSAPAGPAPTDSGASDDSVKDKASA